MDTGRETNWAVAARPVSRPCGVYSFDGSDDPDVGGWRTAESSSDVLNHRP